MNTGLQGEQWLLCYQRLLDRSDVLEAIESYCITVDNGERGLSSQQMGVGSVRTAIVGLVATKDRILSLHAQSKDIVSPRLRFAEALCAYLALWSHERHAGRYCAGGACLSLGLVVKPILVGSLAQGGRPLKMSQIMSYC